MHYEQCVASGKRQTVPSSVAVDIDTAITRIMAVFSAAPGAPGGKQRREALRALVGLRLSLFPGEKLADFPKLTHLKICDEERAKQSVR